MYLSILSRCFVSILVLVELTLGQGRDFKRLKIFDLLVSILVLVELTLGL